MYFSLLRGKDYNAGDGSEFTYSGDTLELEILETTDAGTLISERITPGSNMMAESTTYYRNKDSVYTNYWRIEGDSLFVAIPGPLPTSHLLFAPRLKFSDYTEPEVEMVGWRTSYDYSESDAQLYTTDYSLFGMHYDTLSVYIHNSPMGFDAFGSTTVYDREAGIVRSSTYGWWTQTGIGWDRIYE